jgi:site-specific DNA-methyltransferase (adenine-specific)
MDETKPAIYCPHARPESSTLVPGQCGRDEHSVPHTSHRLMCADSRDLSFLADESVHLVLTSPPYWTLKQYRPYPSQLWHIRDYQEFLSELKKVWRHCYRLLVPGGRLVCVVGDVCLSRREHGRHAVIPLHSDITLACREIGFDNLNQIIWLKISNASFEANQSIDRTMC